MKKLIVWTFLLVLVKSAFASSFVIEMKRELNPLQLASFSALPGVNKVELFTPFEDSYFRKLYLVEFDDSKNDLALLEKNNLVQKIEKSFLAQMYEIKPAAQTQMLTDDMLFPLQWGIYNQEQIIISQKLNGGAPNELVGKKGVDIGWKNSIESIEKGLRKTPVVAVIDTGIDFEHPDLADQILKNEAECTADGQVPVDKNQDKDNNGYKADCLGFNFAATDPAYIPFPLDDKNHGTHVAGIIAAKRNNQLGIAGVSDKIKIVPIKVTGYVDETRERESLLLKAPSERIARGILYAVARGVDAINLSLGWPKSMDTEYMRRAILIAQSKNIALIAAAGNNNTNGNIYPCAYEGVICVGSVNADGKVSEFSNYGGEVDILAPGDQILSTIPTSFAPIKMNTQGYDILSGTSQAAPFVTATVALLKGTYPEMTIDQIKGRLFSGAKNKNDKFKSMHGLLNIGDSFLPIEEPNVEPIFKSKIYYQKEQNGSDNFVDRFKISQSSEIMFNRINGQFMFPLYLHNLGTPLEEKKVKVVIQFHTTGIRLEANTFHLGEAELKIPLAVKGQILNKYMDNKVRYSVFVNNQEYIHEVSLSKMSVILGQNQKIQGGIDFKVHPALLQKLGGNSELHKYLRTVEEKIIKSDFPTYYLKHQLTKAEDGVLEGIRLYFFTKDGDKYVQLDESFFIENAVKLLEVTKGDFNYDASEDYLIKTIVMPKEGEGYVLYSYRDLKMRPLLGKYSDIRYASNVVNVTPDTVRYRKTQLPNGQFLATPYFVTSGILPDQDQLNDPWLSKDRSVMRRIYSLEVKDGDIPCYQVRSFMNSFFIKEIRKQMQAFDDHTVASNDTSVEIIQLQTQSTQDYYSDKIAAMASYGLGYFRTNLKIIISQGKLTYQPTHYVAEKLIGNAQHPLIRLEDNQVLTAGADAYVAFLTQDVLTISTDNNQESTHIVYRDKDENDQVLSFISIFEQTATQYLFMETIDHLLVVKNENGQQKIAKRKTKKFSFLPGSKMSELYYPIVIRDKQDNFKPAIYVDATQLSNNHIYLNTLINDELIAPVDLSLAVPSYCTAKNPYPTKDGNYRYILLCSSAGEMKMIVEDLVTP